MAFSGDAAGTRSGPTERKESAARMKRRRACLELGQRKEDFELQGLLGQGSYAHVYKARSRHSGRKVAIKVIDKTLIASCPGLAERVRVEAETHILLDHPSIVRLHTFFEDDSNVYFVMDICEGGELFHYIRNRGGLPEREARRMFTEVLTGLQHLHAQNIVHRDLKLSNLLLTLDMQVKISDFGLSVVLCSERGESGTMCGTPNYMSPEVISSSPHGLASDVWSLGCLLYTMLVGVPPFEAITVDETLRRIANVEYSVPAHVSREAAALIARLLVRDPTQRISLNDIMRLPFVTNSAARMSAEGAADLPCPQNLFPASPAAAVSHVCGQRTNAIAPHQQHPPTPEGESVRGVGGQPRQSMTGPPETFPACASARAPRLSLSAVESTGNGVGANSLSKGGTVDVGVDANMRMIEPLAGRGGCKADDGGRVVAGGDGNSNTSFSMTLLSARSHVIATPVSSAHSQTRTGRQEGEGRRQTPGDSDASFRRSAQYTRPTTPCQPSTPKKRDKRVRAAQQGNVAALMVMDTSRMKPNVYETKAACLSINADGEVLVHSKRGDSGLLIRRGGTCVRVLRDVAAHATGEVRCEQAGCEEDTDDRAVESLSKQHLLLHQYACKMIRLIQARTPLVVYYSPLACARLMNDGRGGARATFECDFYRGGRVVRPGGTSAIGTGSPGDCHNGLVVVSGNEDGHVEDAGGGCHQTMLEHARFCLDYCARAVASLEEAADGGGDYPIVMAHKQAMHRLNQPQTRRATERCAAWLESSGPSAVTSVASGTWYQQSTASCASTIPSDSRFSKTGAVAHDNTDKMLWHSRHGRGGAGVFRHDETSAAPGRGGSNSETESDCSRGAGLQLGAAGRVFEFADHAGRPVIHKTAFFPGFGWVLCLSDGGMWGQLLDGSQLVVSDSQAVHVDTDGQRRLMRVQHGLVQEDGSDVAAGTMRITEQLMLLRGVM